MRRHANERIALAVMSVRRAGVSCRARLYPPTRFMENARFLR